MGVVVGVVVVRAPIVGDRDRTASQGVRVDPAARVVQRYEAVAALVVGVASAVVIHGDRALVLHVDVVVVRAPIVGDRDRTASQGVRVDPAAHVVQRHEAVAALVVGVASAVVIDG